MCASRVHKDKVTLTFIEHGYKSWLYLIEAVIGLDVMQEQWFIKIQVVQGFMQRSIIWFEFIRNKNGSHLPSITDRSHGLFSTVTHFGTFILLFKEGKSTWCAALQQKSILNKMEISFFKSSFIYLEFGHFCWGFLRHYMEIAKLHRWTVWYINCHIRSC